MAGGTYPVSVAAGGFEELSDKCGAQETQQNYILSIAEKSIAILYTKHITYARTRQFLNVF